MELNILTIKGKRTKCVREVLEGYKKRFDRFIKMGLIDIQLTKNNKVLHIRRNRKNHPYLM